MSLWDAEDNREFLNVMLALGSNAEAELFLRDLMTEAEIAEFAKRWKAARLLNEGVPYTSIEAETGLSSATIARVSKWLQKGQGGYRVMLDKLSRLAKHSSQSGLAIEKTVIQESSGTDATESGAQPEGGHETASTSKQHL